MQKFGLYQKATLLRSIFIVTQVYKAFIKSSIYYFILYKVAGEAVVSADSADAVVRQARKM